jgi:nicotinamidase-related amidase
VTIDPATTAVLTMETQRGVVGDLSALPELARAAQESGAIANAGRLARAARARGIRVVHCTAAFRADRAGSGTNAPLIKAMAKQPVHLLEGSPACEIVPEIGFDDVDLEVRRYHGMSPFTGTNLDTLLRYLGVRTVIATGVSLNIAIVGLAIEAVGLGYDVIVATDAVAGVPVEFAQAVLDYTIRPLAVRMTVDEIISQF